MEKDIYNHDGEEIQYVLVNKKKVDILDIEIIDLENSQEGITIIFKYKGNKHKSKLFKE
jgi:hypothetical protein